MGPLRIVSERQNPIQGETVNKIGAETGWTVGNITRTRIHGRNNITGRVLLFQSVVNASAAARDSGAPVFRIGPLGRNVRLYGILWGGIEEENVFVFSPMSGIEAELGSMTTFNNPPTGDEQWPDLVPVKKPGHDGPDAYCRLSPTGEELIVRVRNQTNIDVLTQTTTTVLFSEGGLVSKTTPPLAGGASADVSFPIPNDCTFTIAVDASIQVQESHGDEIDRHETNNIRKGKCIGLVPVENTIQRSPGPTYRDPTHYKPPG